MHKFLFYNKLIIFLYMFLALLCSSSGDQNCIMQHLVTSHCAGGRLLRAHRTATYRVWRYQMLCNTILPPDYEHNSARNM